MNRPLYWLPDVMVEWLAECPTARRYWSEAWLELHARIVDAAEAEANPEHGGPYLVSPPEGMH